MPPLVRETHMRLIISQWYNVIIRKTSEMLIAKIRIQSKENQQVFWSLH